MDNIVLHSAVCCNIAFLDRSCYTLAMRIVILEDDEAINKALKMTLEKDGYAVDSFTDGEKGERHIILNHSNYDLIILDIMMPGRNGIEICNKVREKSIATPILMLTGLSNAEDKVAALDAGADDYLTKPFSVEELSARVRALLRRPKQVLPSKLQMGDLSVESSTRKVFCGDKEILLTLKEFRILEYLIRNSNQVVTRDQILDHVWDFEFNSFSNIVDVHINNLRKKLQKAGSQTTLETIRGVGYQIKS